MCTSAYILFFLLIISSGEITSRLAIDLESMKARTISIPVIATDGGGRSAYTKVNVLLRDKNDNPPVFEFSEYQAYVKADTAVGTKIMKV